MLPCIGFDKKRVSCIWLPAEVWMDVFKFLARRALLNHVQPTCRRFHALAECHVHNMHVVRHITRFLDELVRNCRKANKHCKQLAASDASLAQHFRLQLDEDLKFYLNRESKPARAKRLRRAQMCFLRHSLDLFRGCRLRLELDSDNAREFPAFLELLRAARPFDVEILILEALSDFRPEELLHEPTILECPRLTFRQYPQLTLDAESICNWLHHLPVENGAQEQESARTRIFNVVEYSKVQNNDTFAETIEYCKKRLQQSVLPSDRRTFLLNFRCNTKQHLAFRIDHPATGEVLNLEQYDQIDYFDHSSYWYHLRRCLVTDLAMVADQFYDVTIRDEGHIFFRSPLKDGLEAPTLSIQPYYIEYGLC